MEETLRPSPPQRVRADSAAKDVLRALRARQWPKNFLVGAGFLFAGHLRTAGPRLAAELLCVALAFVCFCALSSGSYLVNDLTDLQRDCLHPVKRHRPLASGRMQPATAVRLIGVCAAVALASALAIVALAPAARVFPGVALCYLALTASYSFYLKHEVVIDVLVLASGFVVRVIAGCVALPVTATPSPWIIFCTFTLALFIVLCKRRAELLEVDAAPGAVHGATRSVLSLYTVELLDSFIAIAAGLTVTAYSLYTFSAQRSTALSDSMHDKPLLMMTIPFVVYGVFRFLYLAHSSPVGGEPETMLRDKPLMINAAIWAALVAILTLVS
jgi:4-hydroxybenzoate polyprenyltransferase